MKFSHLILRKIIKFVATGCQILRLKCTKFNFGWGLTQTPLGELTALPQIPQLDLRGLLLRERRGRKWMENGRVERVGKRKEGEEWEERERGKEKGPPRFVSHPDVQNPEKYQVESIKTMLTVFRNRLKTYLFSWSFPS